MERKVLNNGKIDIKLRDVITIAILLCSVAIAWGSISTKTAQMEKDININRENIDAYYQALTDYIMTKAGEQFVSKEAFEIWSQNISEDIREIKEALK